MSRHVQAWINSVEITDASHLVILREPAEQPPETELITGERPGAPGARLIGTKRTRLTVTLGFVLRNIFDLAARTQAIEDVNAWAQDGILELSNHEGRQLQMAVTKRAALGTIRDYNQVYTIECAALACPFWQDKGVSSASASGASGTVHLSPPGTVDRLPLELTVTPASAALTSLTVGVNGKQMQFGGFSLPAGQALRLYYDEQMLQWITLNGVSTLGARQSGSADDLFVLPRQDNAISFTANTSVQIQARARGLYL